MPYNAPEMFVTHSNEHDLRALDMWAAGIVLYATVLSAFPWERAAASDQHYRAYKAGDTGALDGWDRLGEKEIELLQGLVRPLRHVFCVLIFLLH
jgi:serine/threonine protein kinase